MNIILFEPSEIAGDRAALPLRDERAVHIRKVLRLSAGGQFEAGIINSLRGRATLEALTADSMRLSFAWCEEPPPLDPISLIVGMCRPQTAKKVLEQATTLGVASMTFVRTDLGESSYGDSPLWHSGEWRRHLILGAQQAVCTRLPGVRYDQSLRGAIETAGADGSRVALDNYEVCGPLSEASLLAPTVVAIGPERGWSEHELVLLHDGGFEFAHLGRRVLRTETATVAAVSLVKARLGLL